MEREQLAQCPYDRSHLIRVSRLPYHLVKCQRNNPQVARTLATCPFNATHRVPRAELQSHVASCPNKFQLDLPDEMSASIGNRMKQTDVPTTWQPPPCQEDWEAELENLEDAPPFILNIKPNNPLLPCHSWTCLGAGGPPPPPSAPTAPGAAEKLGGGVGFGASSFMCASNRANNGLATLCRQFFPRRRVDPAGSRGSLPPAEVWLSPPPCVPPQALNWGTDPAPLRAPPGFVPSTAG